MSESSSPRENSPRKRLPVKPSEEHLKKQAKRRLKLDPQLKLADAQHQLALEYGCRNWAALMHVVETMNRGADQLVSVKNEMEPLPKAANAGDIASVRTVLAAGEFTQHDLDLALARSVLRFNEPEEIAKLPIASLLLENNANPRHAGEDHSTPLHLAAKHGPLAMVELLLRHNAKEWLTDKDGKKPIDYARAGSAADKEAIIELLDRPVIRDPQFKQAVRAIHSGDLEGLRAIVHEHPNLVQDRAMEPDCYPQAYFSNPKLLWFVANNPTLMDKMPLNIATIAEAIISAGASQKDMDYTLELVMTSSPAREQHLQLPLMKVLLDHGAKPGDLLSVLAHRELEPVRFLLQQGVPTTAPIAAGLGIDNDLLALLKQCDAKTRQAAFGIAVINQQLTAAKLCLDAGVDVNAFLPIHAHSLPTHQAAVNDDVPMLKLLIEHGGRLDIRDTLWNATPLNWAMHTGKPAAQEYLRSIHAP
jgi:peptide-methionine (S)-S-oxide reductase